MLILDAPDLVIVDPRIFEAVEQMRQADPSAEKMDALSARRSANNRFLLARRTFCGCGRILQIAGTIAGDRRVKCGAKPPDDTEACRNGGFSLRALELLALRGLRELLAGPVYEQSFLSTLRRAGEEHRHKIEGDRRNLDQEIERLDRKLNDAMDAMISDPRLLARREARLRDMENQLEELKIARQMLTTPSQPEVSEEALPKLAAVLDELERRAPFVPSNPSEYEVQKNFQAIVRAVRPRRIDRCSFEVEIDYDVGVPFGCEAGVGRITKTMLYDTRKENHSIRALRKMRAAELLSGGEFSLTDEQYREVSANESFEVIFRDEDPETRKHVARMLVLRMAARVPYRSIHDALECGAAGLVSKVIEFRKSPGIEKFKDDMCRFFPGLGLEPSALTVVPKKKSQTLAALRRTRHPFLRLEMCRKDSDKTGIPDHHWCSAVSRLQSASRGRVVDDFDQVRRSLESLASLCRDERSFDDHVEPHGMTRSQIAQQIRHLQNDGRFDSLSSMLLDFQKSEARTIIGYAASTGPSASEGVSGSAHK